MSRDWGSCVLLGIALSMDDEENVDNEWYSGLGGAGDVSLTIRSTRSERN